MEKIQLDKIKKAISEIPEDALGEIYDFIEFLKWRREKKEIEFDEWAINLAKEKGFDHLTEEDVIKIVKECRRETSV